MRTITEQSSPSLYEQYQQLGAELETIPYLPDPLAPSRPATADVNRAEAIRQERKALFEKVFVDIPV